MKFFYYYLLSLLIFQTLFQQITSQQQIEFYKEEFKKFLDENVRKHQNHHKNWNQIQTVRTMPQYAYSVYLIIADDDNSNFVWNINQPYVPDYLTNININLYSLGMISPTMCIDNPCGGFLSCCGNASYSNILTPPQSLIYLSQNRGSGAGQIPDSAVVLWTIGGEIISDDANLWTWLENGDENTMQAYAQGVANWQQYNVDGINLDIEENAGSNLQLCQNLVKWVQMIKQLWPTCIIGASAYEGGEYGRYSQNLLSTSGYLDFIQIMTYSVSAEESLSSAGKLICGSDNSWPCSYNSTTSLQNYNTCVKNNQVQNCFMGLGNSKVLLGTAGGSTQVVLSTAQLVEQNGLGGLMIWCSVVCAKSLSVYDNGSQQQCTTPCTSCQTPTAWNITGVNIVDYCPCSTSTCCSVCGDMCFGPYYSGMNMAEYENILSTDATVNDYLAASQILTMPTSKTQKSG